MRGRTNITQRSGTVPVNGDIKEFEVAEGNEINVGDFVSYEKNILGPINISSISEGNDYYNYQIIINEITYLKINVVDNKITIYLVKNGIVISSVVLPVNYTRNNKKPIILLGNKLIFLHYSYYYIYEINNDFSNIELVKTGEAIGINVDFSSVYNNKIIFGSILSASMEVKISYLDENNNLIIENTFSLETKGNYYYESNVPTFTFDIVNNVLNIWVGNIERYYWEKGVIHQLNINETEVTYLKGEDFGILPLYTFKSMNYIGDKMFFNFCYNETPTYSEVYNRIKYGIISIVNINENGIINIETSYTFPGYIGISSSSKNYPYFTSGYDFSFIPIDNNYFLGFVSSVYKRNAEQVSSNTNENEGILFYSIFQYKDGTFIQLGDWKELLRHDETILESSYYKKIVFNVSYNLFFKNNNEYDVYLGMAIDKSSYYEMSRIVKITFKIENNEISGISDKVYNYNGSSIGFAKTSGNPGDIIQVYVPKSN